MGQRFNTYGTDVLYILVCICVRVHMKQVAQLGGV